jgi:hypothetical protein
MKILSRAQAIVEKAEHELRQLLSQAAAAGEYDCLVTLADGAKQLASLARAISQVDTDAMNGSRATLLPIGCLVPVAHEQLTVKAGADSITRKSRKREYPKFLRERNDLVKIGWSKREKSPYEHKAPKAVIVLLARTLVTAGRGGRRFTMDEILPLKQSAGEGDVPSYQTYLALAWFRVEGLVRQHGRQGYSFPDGIDVANEAERRWAKLPAR